jgi:hypothetical protein
MLTQATIRSLNVEDECEDDNVYNAFRFRPAFAIDVKAGLGVDSATILVHFCTNSEGDNDMQPSDLKRILAEALAIAVLED